MSLRTTLLTAAVSYAAGAAGVALADKRNRNKIGKSFNQLKKGTERTIKDIDHNLIRPIQKASKDTQKAIIG